jgi:GNAT superfamily N-acetyltransferase
VFEYRALERRDLEAAGRLLVDAYPHRAHEPPSWQRPAPQERPQRWGAFHQSSVDDRQSPADIAAYAALWRVEAAKFRFDVVVSPGHVRHGLGRGLFDIIVREAQNAGAATLQARAYDTNVDSLAFLARRQFVETMRMRGFVLDLTRIDMRSLPTDPTAVPDVSISAISTADTADPGFWIRLADLHEAAREDWPDPDPGGPIPPVTPAGLRSMFMPSDEPPVAFFVASHGDQFVGYSALMRRRAAGEAQFGATAVRPSVRRQGLGTALRARCLVVAREAGYSTVRSASGSVALIRINARFGFRETYCEIRLVRRLK